MKLVAKHNNLKFVVEDDLPGIGFYLYVFNSDDRCIADYLQDTEIMVKEFALEEFGVPINLWDTDERTL